MTIRFFILQAHYRSTLDFSNEALQAAEKGLDRLMKAVETLGKLTPSAVSTVEVDDLRERYEEAMNDDLNSPLVHNGGRPRPVARPGAYRGVRCARPVR